MSDKCKLVYSYMCVNDEDRRMGHCGAVTALVEGKKVFIKLVRGNYVLARTVVKPSDVEEVDVVLRSEEDARLTRAERKLQKIAEEYLEVTS